MIHEEQLRIVKGLMLRYQKERSEEVFTQILERMDGVLIGIVLKLSRLYFFNEANIQDLYQAGIVGMWKSIDSLKVVDSPNKIILRMFIFIRKELFQSYGRKKMDLERSYNNTLSRSLIPSIDRNLIQEDRVRLLSSLIIKGAISKSDLELIILRFVEEKSIGRIIAEHENKWGKTWSTVNNRINRILAKIREEIGPEEFDV